MRLLKAVAVAIAMLAYGPAHAGSPPGTANPLLKVESWGYQLQAIDVQSFSGLYYDLIVMDYSKAGDSGGVFTRAETDRIRRKPDGGRRILLAYLSIGEAESYRYYWQPSWKSKRPSWISHENRTWGGNYIIHFWHQEWRRIIYEDDRSYLKRIIDAGFDGVYLDRVDVYAELERENANARADMIEFVHALSAKARAWKSDFLVVAQNAEELAASDHYLTAIDGIAKEDLFYGVDHKATRNSEPSIKDSVALLKRARDRHKAVFVVEYLTSPDQLMRVMREIGRRDGRFVPHFADRSLNRVRVERFEDMGHEDDDPG